jgi:cbb3-type cytochrome oxidase subunit 3
MLIWVIAVLTLFVVAGVYWYYGDQYQGCRDHLDRSHRRMMRENMRSNRHTTLAIGGGFLLFLTILQVVLYPR